MTAIVITYILLLIIFLAVSSLILRHAIKFGYLSPRFKLVVGVFGALSLAVIIFSIYLLFLIGPSNNAGSPYSTPVSTPNPSSSSSSDLNF
ncbi:hypothetical protein KKA95_02680 [Patescibacteria group bacterium]|nr:hypothetical protein [Patescibacteria group bacterium]